MLRSNQKGPGSAVHGSADKEVDIVAVMHLNPLCVSVPLTKVASQLNSVKWPETDAGFVGVHLQAISSDPAGQTGQAVVPVHKGYPVYHDPLVVGQRFVPRFPPSLLSPQPAVVAAE